MIFTETEYILNRELKFENSSHTSSSSGQRIIEFPNINLSKLMEFDEISLKTGTMYFLLTATDFYFILKPKDRRPTKTYKYDNTSSEIGGNQNGEKLEKMCVFTFKEHIYIVFTTSECKILVIDLFYEEDLLSSIDEVAGHFREIVGIDHLYNTYVLTGSRDKTVILWDIFRMQ